MRVWALCGDDEISNFAGEQDLDWDIGWQDDDTEPQVFPYEAKARQSPEAKQTYSTMDPIEDW